MGMGLGDPVLTCGSFPLQRLHITCATACVDLGSGNSRRDDLSHRQCDRVASKPVSSQNRESGTGVAKLAGLILPRAPMDTAPTIKNDRTKRPRHEEVEVEDSSHQISCCSYEKERRRYSLVQ